MLQAAVCKQQLAGRSMHMVHYGPCNGHETVLGNAIKCDQICDEDVQFICASDGNVYSM